MLNRIIRRFVPDSLTPIGVVSCIGAYIMAGTTHARGLALLLSLSWILALENEPAWGQTGACCTCPAICQEVADEADCSAIDGVFRAGGTCDPNTCPGVPSNDDCASAIVISGVPCGTPVSFLDVDGDNICATDDGPSLDADLGSGGCASSVIEGEIRDDVWYRYTAEYDGTLTVSGCEATTYDQMIAIYDATSGCPLATSDEIACNDDGCGTSLASIVEVGTTVGDELLIRVGGWNDEVPGGFNSNPRGEFVLYLTYGVSCILPCRWLEPGEVVVWVPGEGPVFEFVAKNRYITLSSACAPTSIVNYDVQMTLESTLVPGVTAVSSQWWANQPDENCISIVGPTRPASPPNWSDCINFYLTGCPIIPTSTYIIRAMTDTMQAEPIQATTQEKPGDKWWGDVVGSFDPLADRWTPPNGIVAIDDAVAAIKTYQHPNLVGPGCGTPPCNATHVSVTDVHPAGFPGHAFGTPNEVVDINDVFAILVGFQGLEYPGPSLDMCPDP